MSDPAIIRIARILLWLLILQIAVDAYRISGGMPALLETLRAYGLT